MEGISKYEAIINEIKNYYNNIKYYIFLECNYLSPSYMELDFENAFEVNDNQDKFIDYNYETKKFTLSMTKGLKEYNELKERVLLKPIAVEKKFSSNYYKEFSLDDRAAALNFYNKSFNELCYSEFLKAYMKKIIDITSPDAFVVEDFLGEYKERKGAFFSDALAEAKIRNIAKKSSLFYLPEAGYDNDILKTVNDMMATSELWRIILLSNIDFLMNHLSLYQAKKVQEYEQRCFEKKYLLPSNYFEEQTKEMLLYRSIKARRNDLKNKLKMLLNSIVGDKASPGFMSTFVLLGWYIVALGLGYYITKILLGS